MTTLVTDPLYEKVRVYHQVHGDDYGSKRSRDLKYKAVKNLIPRQAETLLDVGCGEGRFKAWVPRLDYVGIDLVYGENVMDETRHFDVVVANGVVYKLPSERDARELLYHCWTLCNHALIFTSLDLLGHVHCEELSLDPVETFLWARKVAGTGCVKVDASYAAHDFTVAMYRP